MAEEARSSRYRYSPLRHARNIRVLDVKPGEYGNEIHFALREHRLDHCGSYHALSYVWGPPIFSKTIFSADGYLTTTPSLHAALQRFRATDQTVALWADAVCINQEDLDERDATGKDQEAFDFIIQVTDKHIKGSLEDAISKLDDQDLDIMVRLEKIRDLKNTCFYLANKIQASEELNDNVANPFLTHLSK